MVKTIKEEELHIVTFLLKCKPVLENDELSLQMIVHCMHINLPTFLAVSYRYGFVNQKKTQVVKHFVEFDLKRSMWFCQMH